MIYARKLTFKTQRSQALAEAERIWLTRRAALIKMRDDASALLELMANAKAARYTWARGQIRSLLASLEDLHEGFDATPHFDALAAAVAEYKRIAALESAALTTEELLTAKAKTQIANRAVSAAEAAVSAAFAAHRLPKPEGDLHLTIGTPGKCFELARTNQEMLREFVNGAPPDPLYDSVSKTLDEWIRKLPARDMVVLIAKECALEVSLTGDGEFMTYLRYRFDRFAKRDAIKVAA